MVCRVPCVMALWSGIWVFWTVLMQINWESVPVHRGVVCLEIDMYFHCDYLATFFFFLKLEINSFIYIYVRVGNSVDCCRCVCFHWIKINVNFFFPFQPVFHVMGFSVTGRVLNGPEGEGVADATVTLNNQIKGIQWSWSLLLQGSFY